MIFCFGELLLRMSPTLNRQWIKEKVMPVNLEGTELNVAMALCKWNQPVKYCSALPGNSLSSEIIEDLREKGIDVSSMHQSGDRIGTYYLPQGAGMDNELIYDRAYSSFAELTPGMINWDEVLDGCSWFHFSAVSPALNNNVAAVCREALYYASQKKMMISVDLNYQSRLWQYGKKPTQVMPELVNYCSVIVGNIWSVESLLGVPSNLESKVGKSKQELEDAAAQSMMDMKRQFEHATSIAYTFRSEKNYWAVLQQGKEKVVSREFEMGEEIDNDDTFVAGLIYGLFNKQAPQEVVDFAVQQIKNL